jgi:hypothetical protein
MNEPAAPLVEASGDFPSQIILPRNKRASPDDNVEMVKHEIESATCPAVNVAFFTTKTSMEQYPALVTKRHEPIPLF